MKLADVSIRRPVFATMMIMSLIVLGLFSYRMLNVDLYPDVDIPYVVITTVLPGAGPEQIETDVTKIIEDAVNPVEGVDFIQSTSQENVSIVVIAFKLEINGKDAAQDVREKISAIRANLPLEIEDPVIQRYDPASLPIMYLSVSGNMSDKDITTFTKDVVKQRLENIPGVGSVQLVGGSEREIQIEVDAARLRAYNISIQDVIMNVGGQNVEIPGGNVTEGTRQLLVRTMGKYQSVDDFNKVIVATPLGKPVYLSDVATVTDGIAEQTSLTRVNGKIAVGLNIIKQSGSNTVQVAQGVNKQIEKMKNEIPAGVSINVAQDNSIFIEHSINDVLFDILYGGLLAVIVIYMFLANFRATIISGLALPASIIASFIIMFALGFTLNMMSLLALSLAVGLLIDDAIVVIENIYRHMAQGETPMEAAKSASEEIGLAVMATTFTIVAVFVPVAFMPGIVGRFFYEFGITISAAVIVSLFVAFTLTPMLSSKWLHREDEALSKEGNPLHKFLYYFNHFFEFLNGKYEKALRWSLSHRKTIVFGAIGIFVASFFLMGMLGSQFFPESDKSEFNVSVNASPGSSLEQTSLICEKVENILREKPEITTVLTTIGSGNDPVTKANILVKLIPTKERKKSDKQIMAEIRSEVKNIAGAKISFTVEGVGGGGGEKPVTLSIRGEDLSNLEKIAEKVEAIVKSTPGAVDVDNSLELSKPEIRINIDREKASDLAVNPYLIASTIRAMIDGAVATQFKEGDEQIDVRVRLKQNNRKNLNDLLPLTIKSNKKIGNQDFLVPITDIATITQDVGPSKINRYARQKEIRVDANLDGRFLGVVLGDILAETSKLELEPGYSINVIGEGEMQDESMANMLLTLLLAVVFVYIVLAAQFDSFVHPFSIMLALPMSIIGAVLALLIFGSSLSVMSMIGIIMLMGLVTKNGILLVDYTNVMRERGMSRFDALVKAGPTRLRPILMTTFAMIFGMVPVALALGEGAEFRAPMGQAVIGGLITSTLLTLFIVPVVYSILDDLGTFSFSGFFRKIFSGSKK
ncbi:MAG: efflux RND transporter permease subunit [Ignavibacterium sp.]|jgi:HAE1 family hydrophobic/amphiphilic exporter-1|nr:efflux RND transporter permease subunit [Ignavibacterium sp.]